MPYFLTKNHVFLILLAISGCFFNHKMQLWQLTNQEASSLSLSRDGRFALAFSKVNGIVLWDLKQNEKLADLGAQDPNNNTVIASRISDNKRYAITATTQNFAVWDLAWGQANGLWSISDGKVKDVDIANDGKQLVLALTNKKALYLDLTTGRRLEFLAHKEAVNSVAISPNGDFVLSGGNDHHAYLWHTKTGQIIRNFELQHRVNLVALHRNGLYAFSSDVKGNAFIWNLKTGAKRTELHSIYRFLTYSCARFSDDGNYIATGTPSGRVEYWRTQNGDNLERWVVTNQTELKQKSVVVLDVAIDEMQRIIATGSNGTAQAWAIN